MTAARSRVGATGWAAGGTKAAQPAYAAGEGGAMAAGSGTDRRGARLVAVLCLLAALALSALAALRPGGWVWLIPGPIYIMALIALIGGSASWGSRGHSRWAAPRWLVLLLAALACTLLGLAFLAPRAWIDFQRVHHLFTADLVRVLLAPAGALVGLLAAVLPRARESKPPAEAELLAKAGLALSLLAPLVLLPAGLLAGVVGQRPDGPIFAVTFVAQVLVYVATAAWFVWYRRWRRAAIMVGAVVPLGLLYIGVSILVSCGLGSCL